MPFAKKSQSALLIVGHGSTENPDSSQPYFDHAAEIRRRELFAEVHCCFWKEEPSMREALSMIDATEVYVVPDFISEGYFTQEVIPRELLLDARPHPSGKTLKYCRPVGIHPHMTDLLLRRAREVAPDIPPDETTVIITGHGTGLNQNSTQAIRDQVELIRHSGAGYAAVLDAYMEEQPFIADWHTLADTPNVIVVPFFIADGLHSYQDIPVLLGMEKETGPAASQRDVFRHNPHHIHGKNLYYTSAIGTERLIADVIIDLVEDYDAAHVAGAAAPVAGSSTGSLTSKLAHLLCNGLQAIGELRIGQNHCGHPFTLCHHLDWSDTTAPQHGKLMLHHGPDAARDLSTFAPDGSYRFAKAQTNLQRGWLLALADVEELRRALDLFYPAALGLHIAHSEGRLDVQHLRDKLNRQTGMYRFARTIADADAQELIRTTCGPSGQCARRILWQIDADTALDDSEASRYQGMPAGLPANDTIPLLCREACNHFVAACRKTVKARATQ